MNFYLNDIIFFFNSIKFILCTIKSHGEFPLYGKTKWKNKNKNIWGKNIGKNKKTPKWLIVKIPDNDI